MATVYISPSGAGNGSGDSEANAVNWNSGAGLGTAETAAGANGTIIFLDGSYPFGGSETFDGASGITYESQNINGAVLGDTGTNQLLTIGSASVGGLTLKNFKFVDLYFYAGLSLPVNCTVENCYLAATVAEDYTSITPKIKAQGTAAGVYLIFKNCVIEYNCNTSADRLLQGDDYKLLGCTNYITTGSATNIGWSYGPPAEIKNCIWFSDDDTAISSTTGSGSTARGDFATYSTFSSFYQMGSTNDSGGTDNLYDTNPLFVDSANGDYRLRPSSPCINAGTAS
jgi:hypothetical protein